MSLTESQKKGIRASILILMLILVLFVLVMVAGRPITDFKTEPLSVVYAVVIYVPVMAVCALAYGRLGRR